MEPITIKHCTVEEMQEFPNLMELLSEYADESAIPELGSANPRVDMYAQMESIGTLRMVAAINGEQLVGLLVLIVSVLPHFNVLVGSTESFFVLPEYRKSGVGLKLLREAERMSEQAGAAGLFVSAPIGGKLDDVMGASREYRPTNRVHFKAFR